MFSLPHGTASGEAGPTPHEGLTDANPIYLAGVTTLEFKTLLKYFFEG
jgi:hypothetical protein